jgi:hypothetical protein
VGVLAAVIVEVNPDVRLVGKLVEGEPGAPVDAEQRTPRRSRVG